MIHCLSFDGFQRDAASLRISKAYRTPAAPDSACWFTHSRQAMGALNSSNPLKFLTQSSQAVNFIKHEAAILVEQLLRRQRWG
jgi:hypothetical protein